MYSQYAHQQETIERTIAHFQAQSGVSALLLGGSIAHGLANEASDVDILIFVSEDEYQDRVKRQRMQFFSKELATYEVGYVDGKYLSESFLAKVEERGSEPARFAFADAQILFSQIDDLAERMARVTRYPVEHKINRIQRFNAQIEAWHWFTGEAAKKQNAYLMTTAISRLLLFGGRMLLAHNEMLYPFHKWFLAQLDRAQDKPDGIVALMRETSAQPTQANIDRFYETIKNFREWEVGETIWPNWFMEDTEWTWMDGLPSIEDI